MTMTHSSHSIAIIGAGLSGTLLARKLLDAGHTVTLYDKSRGTGGRFASCWLDDISTDLGAPWIETPNDPDFAHWLNQQALIQPWQPRLHDFQGNPRSPLTCYITTERMSSLTRQLAHGTQLRLSKRVGYLWPTDEGVLLRDEHGIAINTHSHVIVTVPAPQAAPLLEAVPRFAQRAERVETQPSWVGVFVLQSPTQTPEGFIGTHPVFARVVKASQKPGRLNTPEIWQVEATPQWSQQHLETPAEEVGIHLLEALSTVIGEDILIKQQRIHRWLYSRHASTCDEAYLWSKENSIGACGDWLGKAGIEGAWESANAMADQLLTQLHP